MKWWSSRDKVLDGNVTYKLVESNIYIYKDGI